MKGIIAIMMTALLAFPSDGIFFGNRSGVRVIGGCTEVGCDYSEERSLQEFDAVSTSGTYNVHYVQSRSSKVVVEGKKEFVSQLITEVSGKTLRIKLKDGTYKGLVLKVTVYSPVLDGIRISGSGNFIEHGPHHSTGNIDFSLSGSGGLKAESIDCKSFSAKISGSGSINVPSVKGTDLNFRISGSGSVNVGSARAGGNMSMSFSGSGSGKVDKADVTGTLDLSISGSGNIDVNGRVGSVTARTSGSGNIHGNLKYGSIDTHTSGSGRVRFSNN